jgi:hypothetical protein
MLNMSEMNPTARKSGITAKLPKSSTERPRENRLFAKSPTKSRITESVNSFSDTGIVRKAFPANPFTASY